MVGGLIEEGDRVRSMQQYIDGAVSRSKPLSRLRDGLVNCDDMLNGFDAMVKNVNGQEAYFENSKGEIVRLLGNSRWVEGSSYGSQVRKKFESALHGSKRQVHLVLTVSEERVNRVIPEWFDWGFKPFMVIFGGICLSYFLNRVYKSIVRGHARDWNYILSMMEFHKSGVVHWHMIFEGQWVLELEDLWRYWPIAEFQGVRLGKRLKRGDLARYLTAYLVKDLKVMRESGDRLALASMYHFKKRLFNIRHRRPGS